MVQTDSAKEEEEFLMLESLERSGSKFTIQQYQFDDPTAEIISTIAGQSMEVRQYDMEFYNDYLRWKKDREPRIDRCTED